MFQRHEDYDYIVRRFLRGILGQLSLNNEVAF
jgi:hypothetical protein